MVGGQKSYIIGEANRKIGRDAQREREREKERERERERERTVYTRTESLLVLGNHGCCARCERMRPAPSISL